MVSPWLRYLGLCPVSVTVATRMDFLPGSYLRHICWKWDSRQRTFYHDPRVHRPEPTKLARLAQSIPDPSWAVYSALHIESVSTSRAPHYAVPGILLSATCKERVLLPLFFCGWIY